MDNLQTPVYITVKLGNKENFDKEQKKKKKKKTFLKIITEERQWRNFLLTFSECTKN